MVRPTDSRWTREDSRNLMTEKLYNICYNGRALYQSMTLEDCTEVLQEFSERFFSGEDIDPNLISLEPLFED